MLILKNKVVYFGLLALFGATIVMRSTMDAPTGFFYEHISNFAITGGLFLLAITYMLLKQGFTRKKLLTEAAPYVLLNIILELFVRVDTLHLPGVDFVNFNTPDPVDMVFGLVAVGLVVGVVLRFSVPALKKPAKAG